MENLNYTHNELAEFTHLLVEAKSKHNSELWSALQEDFETVEFVDCFNNIAFQYNTFLPIRIKTKPCVGLLRRRKAFKEIKEKRDKLKNKKTKEKHLKNANMPAATTTTNDEENLNMSVTPSMENSESSTLNVLSASMNATQRVDFEDGIVADVADVDFVDVFDDEQQIQIEDENELPILHTSAEHEDAAAAAIAATKEINFEELRNLATAKLPTVRTKATKLKIRKIIEQHYHSKGRQIESDSHGQHKSTTTNAGGSMRQSVKSIIKQERIKEMIEQISTMDLTKLCDLDKLSTKDCLKQVIDKLDEESNAHTKT